MKTFFDIREGALVESTSDAAKVLIYAVPDGAEKQELLDILSIDTPSSLPSIPTRSRVSSSHQSTPISSGSGPTRPHSNNS